jgi:hypothetical protein
VSVFSRDIIWSRPCKICRLSWEETTFESIVVHTAGSDIPRAVHYCMEWGDNKVPTMLSKIAMGDPLIVMYQYVVCRRSLHCSGYLDMCYQRRISLLSISHIQREKIHRLSYPYLIATLVVYPTLSENTLAILSFPQPYSLLSVTLVHLFVLVYFCFLKPQHNLV